MPIAYLAGTSAPAVYMDCSEWVNYALDSVAPIHQAAVSAENNDPLFNPGRVNAYDGPVTIREALQPWPRAAVLSFFFGNVANVANGFVEVDNFATLQAGDLVAYANGIYTDPRNPNASQIPALVKTDDTGHAMIVVGSPVEVPRADWGAVAANVAHVYAVPVVDSSGTRHFGNLASPRAPEAFVEPIADNRSYSAVKPIPELPADKQSGLSPGGLGTGTLWFATDANGHALEYRWGFGDPWFGNDASDAAVSIAAARLTDAIDLSGPMLDANNRLVVTAFADAASVLNGVAYNTQAETVTGAGGLWVEGGGKVMLGGGNSFSGGLFLDGATVELAGAGAAGTGAITFVKNTTSTLLIDSAGAVPVARITGFDSGDTIDLAFHGLAPGDHLVWTQATSSGGTLALVGPTGSPVASLALGGAHTSVEFSLASDGHGGTLVAGPSANASIDDTVSRIFVGYFNRAPDPVGGAYWTDQLHRGLAPVAIAQSFAMSGEAAGLYPYLANPATATPAALKSFVSSVYVNLFARAPDAPGEAFWTAALQAGATTAGAAILSIIGGAHGSDAATLANKVAVGNYYDLQLFKTGAPFTIASANAAIASVTSSDASVTSARSAVEAYASGAPHEVSLVGLSGASDA